jgi:hypothetical protein
MGWRSPLQAYYPKLVVFPGENYILISTARCFKCLSYQYHPHNVIARAGWCDAGQTLSPPAIFGVYVNNMSMSSYGCMWMTQLLATSHSPVLSKLRLCVVFLILKIYMAGPMKDMRKIMYQDDYKVWCTSIVINGDGRPQCVICC